MPPVATGIPTSPPIHRCEAALWVSPTGSIEISDAEAAARHNAKHAEQRQRFVKAGGWLLGSLVYRGLYIFNHFRFGYENNPFELEARDAERTVPGIRP